MRLVDLDVRPGVEKDMGDGVAWPSLRERMLGAVILVVTTPTWMGHTSSVASRVMERLDTELSEPDGEERPPTFGKVARGRRRQRGRRSQDHRGSVPGAQRAQTVSVPRSVGAVPGDRQLPGSSSAVTAGSASWATAVWKMPKFPVIQRGVSLTLVIRHPLEVRSNRLV